MNQFLEINETFWICECAVDPLFHFYPGAFYMLTTIATEVQHLARSARAASPPEARTLDCCGFTRSKPRLRLANPRVRTMLTPLTTADGSIVAHDAAHQRPHRNYLTKIGVYNVTSVLAVQHHANRG